jgi:hypothetical protein
VQELERGKQAQDLRRAANDWAPRFATKACAANRPELLCARLDRPVSAAFRKSFADARAEDIKFKGVAVPRPSIGPLYLATVKFSNGVVVAFVGPGDPACASGARRPPSAKVGVRPGFCWHLADPDQNRRYIQAAGLRE